MRQQRFYWILAGALHAQVNVLTYHNDLARTAQNLNETILKKTNVSGGQFGRLFSNPVDGEVYAQPLYVAGVTVPGKGTHNIVYVATEHDSLYAFDADIGGSPLWKTSFLVNGATPIPAASTGCPQITPEIGITGTPVIDLASGTIYLVAMTLESGSYVARLHALDIAAGTERPASPVTIQAMFPGTGEGGSTLVFNPRNYKQRPGLLLLNGVVFTAWSSHCDIGAYHGWLIGYDARTLSQVAVYNNTPNGNEGSFWAGGAAPAVDSSGNIYLVAGNGSFDGDRGGPDLGEAIIKLSGGLSVLDWFAPFNAASLNAHDVDIGSSGALLLPDEAGSPQHPHLLVTAGKEGRIYLIDRDALGKFQAGSDSQIPQSLANAVGGMFGIPAYFNRTVFFSGSGDYLKAFSIQNGVLSSAPVSKSSQAFGFPGSVPSVSANGLEDGIVWVLEPSGGGRLHAYDASDLSRELFHDSLGSYVKFSTPTIANGKLYAGTQNALVVYGLTPASAAIVNGATFAAGPVAPGSIVSIFGNFGVGATTAQSYPLPVMLGGIRVTMGEIQSPLYYASANQINAQVPFETPAGNAPVLISSNGQPLASGSVSVQATAPEIFAAGLPGGVRAGTFATLYCTGQGAVNPLVASGSAAPANPLSNISSNVAVTVGSQTADVSFAGLAPGFAGLCQINFHVPNLPTGTYPLTLQVGDSKSKIVNLSIVN